MSRLADFGLTITNDAKKRWLIRRGTPVAITPLQRDMLEWLDMTGTPTLGCCCDTLWEQVDEKWVRGQWDKLGTVMLPLGVIAAIDDADAIGLHPVDAEGCPVAPLREDQPKADDAPDHAEIISSLQDEVKTLRQMLVDEAATLRLKLADAEAQAEEFRRERNHHRGCEQEAVAERDRLDALVDELRLLNDKLSSQVASALDRAASAEEEIARLKESSTPPSAEVVHLRDYPVRIAPRYLTVAVSEPLFRWLEASGDRNRRSADDMARALLLAFMRSTGNREAA